MSDRIENLISEPCDRSLMRRLLGPAIRVFVEDISFRCQVPFYMCLLFIVSVVGVLSKRKLELNTDHKENLVLWISWIHLGSSKTSSFIYQLEKSLHQTCANMSEWEAGRGRRELARALKQPICSGSCGSTAGFLRSLSLNSGRLWLYSEEGLRSLEILRNESRGGIDGHMLQVKKWIPVELLDNGFYFFFRGCLEAATWRVKQFSVNPRL